MMLLPPTSKKSILLFARMSGIYPQLLAGSVFRLFLAGLFLQTISD